MKKRFTVVCVFVLPVCRILNLNSEVKTCVENVIEKFIVFRGVYTCTVQLVFHIYIHIRIVLLSQYDLCLFIAEISELVVLGIVPVDLW